MTSPHPTSPVEGRFAAPAPGVRPSVRGSALTVPPERALSRRGLTAEDAVARMKIGEVAERLGLSLRSIRYYEETGLVRPTSRTSGGFRLYSEFDVQRLLLIMQMKPLEFSLDQMREVLDDLAMVQGDLPGRAGVHDDDTAETDDDVRAARERLTAVTHEVENRWASLQQRLEIAAMFREHLAHELDPGAARSG